MARESKSLFQILPLDLSPLFVFFIFQQLLHFNIGFYFHYQNKIRSKKVNAFSVSNLKKKKRKSWCYGKMAFLFCNKTRTIIAFTFSPLSCYLNFLSFTHTHQIDLTRNLFYSPQKNTTLTHTQQYLLGERSYKVSTTQSNLQKEFLVGLRFSIRKACHTKLPLSLIILQFVASSKRHLFLRDGNSVGWVRTQPTRQGNNTKSQCTKTKAFTKQ